MGDREVPLLKGQLFPEESEIISVNLLNTKYVQNEGAPFEETCRIMSIVFEKCCKLINKAKKHAKKLLDEFL